MMNSWLQDFRYSLRVLLKAPGFACAAILTLALGLGANTAIFSVINTVLLSPLPFPHSKELMAVESRSVRNPMGGEAVSYPDFLDWKNGNKVFQSMAAYHTATFTLTSPSTEAMSVQGVVATPDLFSVLGITSRKGRTFGSQEETPGTGSVAVISDSLWRERFAGDSSVIGKVVSLDSRPFTIIGVMEPNFNFPIQQDPPQIWATVAYDILDASPGDPPITTQRGAHYLHVVARLRPQVTAREAQVEMDQIVSSINQQYTDVAPRMAMVVPQLEKLVAGIRPALLILFAAVGLVLLVACANVSNLLFTRLAARQREMGLRAALGAKAGRIVRQLLIESFVLALLGGALGLFLAWGAVTLFLKLHPANLPRIAAISLDIRVLLFVGSVIILTTFIFGVVPAMQVWKPHLAQVIKEGGYTGSEGRQQNRLRQILTVAELAVTVILLTCTGLLLQSLKRLQNVDPGFSPNNLLTAQVFVPSTRYSDAKTKSFYQQLLTRLAALPGARSAAAGSPLPLTDDGVSMPFEIIGRPTPKAQRPRAGFHIISPAYFQTLSVAVAIGREFDWHDDEKALPSVMVNEALAQRFFPNENPIGKTIKLAIGGANSPARQIIGVAGNTKSGGLDADAAPELYVPFLQVPDSMAIVVRTSVAPLTLVSSVRREVAALDPDVAIARAKPFDEYVTESTLSPRFNSLLISVFAALALILTAIGLYGVIAQSVAYRTREIGIRMAVGARPWDVIGMVLRQALKMTAIGIALGVAGTFAFSRVLSGLLFKVSPRDPFTYAAVALFLGCVALVASYVPARRAARISPVIVLK